MNTPIAMISKINASETVQLFLVLPVPSTNVCSNMTFPFALDSRGKEKVPGAARNYLVLTAFFPPVSLSTGAAAGAVRFFRLSSQFCQNTRIGLAMKIDE